MFPAQHHKSNKEGREEEQKKRTEQTRAARQDKTVGNKMASNSMVGNIFIIHTC